MSGDVAREKYLHLMTQIEDLEDRVSDLEQEQTVAVDSPEPEDVNVINEELVELRRQLAEKRNELARLSDGCGRPHPMS